MATETVTLGGKGSSLSSPAVSAVATGLAHVRIDSSALDRGSTLSSSPATTSFTQHCITVPDFLTLHESRAFLLVLLNKLLLSNATSNAVFQLVAEALNSKPQSFRFQPIDVAERDLAVLANASATLLGISAVLDHRCAALSTLADVAAAFSCEALNADVTAFSLMDSGDGHSSKDEVGVAGDMRVLLNGSKLVGKENVGSVARVPKIHGTLREQVKSVHSKMRVELNSGVKSVENDGTEQAVSTVLLPLAATLRELGEGSFARVKKNLVAIGSNDLKDNIGEIFGKQCPTEADLSGAFYAALKLAFGKDYDKFAHEVNVLLELAWKIVAWEAVTAFAVLEAAELSEKTQGVQENGENSKAEKKKKKKKVVLGKGTGLILTLIKDRLQRQNADGNSRLLEAWVGDFLSLLDLADPEFDDFLSKVKDIVESNESRRLPKIPKVILSTYGWLRI